MSLKSEISSFRIRILELLMDGSGIPAELYLI